MGIVRAITVGGSSIYYYGTAFDPPIVMLKRYGLDIEGDVAEARRELPIAPLPPELMGPMATRVMESARDLGLPWNPLPKFIRADRCRSRVPMGYYAAPSYEAKWNARMWVDEAIEHGAVLHTGARVRSVVIERGAARGVVFTEGGRAHEARAECVVVAAGGIGSPVLLRASGLPGAGRDFFIDPIVTAVGEVDGLDAEPEMPMTAGMLCTDDGYMMTDICVPGALFSVMSAQSGRVGRRRRSLQIMIKARDGLGGRVTDREGVRKRLDPADAAKLRHGYERAKSILAHAGARRIYRTGYVGAHPGGTVKVGEMLDENLRTEVENLYVCDCSVIPEPWGLPPTLTLIGLGKRLARHLLASAGRSRAEASPAVPAAAVGR
jgi:choline dehydrogenase-like flavoprotein